MTTPIHTSARPATPLRLSMNEHLGDGAVDGSWWPRSRDAAAELTDLVDQLPDGYGDVLRVVVSASDWDSVPKRLRVARGLLKVGSYPGDDSHQVWLVMFSRRLIRLSVTAPSDEEAPEEPWAGDSEVTELWSDDGGAWWGPSDEAPSDRPAAPVLAAALERS
jgi:hypothetical protein